MPKPASESSRTLAASASSGEPSVHALRELPASVFQARLAPGAPVFEAPSNAPLLLAAERVGLALASSCRNGTCRTCIGQLVSGRVMYRIEWPGLSAEEKAAGRVLPCVAYPLSNVVLGFP